MSESKKVADMSAEELGQHILEQERAYKDLLKTLRALLKIRLAQDALKGE